MPYLVKAGWCAAVALLVAAGVLAVREPPAVPPASIRFDQTDFDLGQAVAGDEVPIVVGVSSQSDQPISIRAQSLVCGDNVCVDAGDMRHVPVPARSRIDYRWTAHVNRPGPFWCELKVYYDDAGIRVETIRLSGVGTGP